MTGIVDDRDSGIGRLRRPQSPGLFLSGLLGFERDSNRMSKELTTVRNKTTSEVVQLVRRSSNRNMVQTSGASTATRLWAGRSVADVKKRGPGSFTRPPTHRVDITEIFSQFSWPKAVGKVTPGSIALGSTETPNSQTGSQQRCNPAVN